MASGLDSEAVFAARTKSAGLDPAVITVLLRGGVKMCGPFITPYSILTTFRQGQWIKTALAQIRVSELEWYQLAQNREAWKMSAGRSENKQKISDLEKRVKDLEEHKDRADNTMRGLKRQLDPMDKSIQVVIENHQDLEKIYQDAEHARN